MRRRVLAGIIGTAAMVVVVTAGVLLGQQSGTPAAVNSDSAAATPAPPAAAATATPTAQPVTEQPSSVPPPPEAADPGGTPPGEPDPGETERSETPPGETPPGETERGETAPIPDPGTAPTAPPALVTLPLPPSSTATGSIVAGFPEGTIPAVPNSVIESSSVAAEGSRLQAALAGQSALTAGEVVDFYGAALGALGMTGAPSTAPDGSAAVTFTRDNNSVALTVTPVDGGSRYVVFGTFTAES